MSEFTQTRTLWEETVQDLISVSEAARLKDINESSVRKAIRTGRLRGKKVGPVHLVSRRQVEAWVLTGKRSSPDPSRQEQSP